MAKLTDWNPALRDEFQKPYWRKLMTFLQSERLSNTVYPPPDKVFAALHLTPLANVKVLVLGQDPYHGPKQAHGLCFSVQTGVPIPPSLSNIFLELHKDVGCAIPKHGNLESWAGQGVLLLNATLTVGAGRAGSHQRQGWEIFTDQVISVVNNKKEAVVFILWGNAARRKKRIIDLSRHVIIESAHPSPLSAHKGFFGSAPFSRTNIALAESGRGQIDWTLPPI